VTGGIGSIPAASRAARTASTCQVIPVASFDLSRRPTVRGQSGFQNQP
jgi:hypothetical protein